MSTKKNEPEKTKTTKESVERAVSETELLNKSFIKKYYRSIPLIATIYAFTISIFFLLQSDFGFSFLKPRVDFDFSEVNSQLQKIESNFSVLEEGIKVISESPDNTLVLRVIQLEKNQESLIETISLDIDKAITAKLLQEKQEVIEADISRLNESQGTVNTRIDTLIITLLATPLIGIILSFLGGLINRPKKVLKDNSSS